MATAGQNFLGPYRLIRLVRSGRRCSVWEAVKDVDRDRVALKVLHEEYKNNKEDVDQLRNEAVVGATLNHPYVIRIFEFNHKYKLPFLVMQLFAAKNLKQELRERPQFVAVNIPGYIRKCAQGLEYLHQQGWIHCDVKPDNFLVDEQGNVKLIDFSIAQPLRLGFRLSFRSKTVQGTRSYMSPEQIRGKSLGATADIYGFGCLLFEVFAGRPPFSGVNPDELLQKHLRSPPPSVQAVNRSVSDQMAALINKMLEKNPKKRPQTMADFLREFDRISVYRAGMRPKLAVEQ